MTAPDRACPDYPNECVHPWAHARTCAEVKATQDAGSRPVTAPALPPALVDTIRQIVFGTRIAGSVASEDPRIIPGVTAERIWINLDAYFTTGDWPDRRRSGAEIDAEESQ